MGGLRSMSISYVFCCKNTGERWEKWTMQSLPIYHYTIIPLYILLYIYIYHTIISFLVAKSSSKKFEFKSNSSGPWILGFPAQHFPQRQCVLKMFRIYFDVRLSIYIYIHIYTYIHIYIYIYISLSLSISWIFFGIFQKYSKTSHPRDDPK
jgi:hypothetical protein